jgi:hypothetical protein
VYVGIVNVGTVNVGLVIVVVEVGGRVVLVGVGRVVVVTFDGFEVVVVVDTDGRAIVVVPGRADTGAVEDPARTVTTAVPGAGKGDDGTMTESTGARVSVAPGSPTVTSVVLGPGPGVVNTLAEVRPGRLVVEVWLASVMPTASAPSATRPATTAHGRPHLRTDPIAATRKGVTDLACVPTGGPSLLLYDAVAASGRAVQSICARSGPWVDAISKSGEERSGPSLISPGSLRAAAAGAPLERVVSHASLARSRAPKTSSADSVVSSPLNSRSSAFAAPGARLGSTACAASDGSGGSRSALM